MAEELKPPVAIRITRPYATEQEFLEREFDTLTHTSVILLGAQQRPQGVVLRFEIVLKSGESLLRGEGRVVAYKEKAYAGEPGLTLRFTRLDSRSKTLVDRASALREARVRASTSLMGMPAVVVPKPSDRAMPAVTPTPPPHAQESETSRPSAPPPPSSRISAPPSSRRAPPPLPDWARSQPPPAPPSSAMELDLDNALETTQVEDRAPLDFGGASPPSSEVSRAAEAVAAAPKRPPSGQPPRPPARPPPLPPPRPLTNGKPSPATPARPAPAASPVDRPANRDELLTRLRTRARELPPARVSEILAHKRVAR